MDQFYEDEIDDISLATELSLLDLNEKGKHVAGNEDEELARAIEESLKSSKKRSYRRAATNRRGIVCDVCGLAQGKICKSDFWNQIFCQNHMQDGTPTCCACNRYQPKDVRYIHLRDGRGLCPDCYSTAVLDTEKSTPIKQNVLEFFKKILGMEISQQIPVYMVDRKEMKKHTNSPGHSDTMTIGLTISRGRSIQILILLGYPKVITGSIMAHEFTHAWLRLQGVEISDPKVEEGIAQVLCYEWLDWFESVDREASSSTSEQAQYVRNLKNHYKHDLEINLSREYGEGFRDAKFAVAKYGIPYVMKYIVRYRSLPK